MVDLPAVAMTLTILTVTVLDSRQLAAGSQASVAAQGSLLCPVGWYQYVPKSSNGSTSQSVSTVVCVKYFINPVIYSEAQRQCRNVRSQLVNVNQTSTSLLASAKAAATTNYSSPCGLSVSGKGALRSPNFPDLYPDHASCLWSLRADGGTSVLLIVNSLNVETCCDTLGVTYSNGRTIRVNATSRQDLLLGSEAQVTFSSDDSLGGPGFTMYFYSVNLVHDCGGTLQDGSGWLASPGYPNMYANYLLCKWTVYPSSGRSLFLQFLSVDLELNYDTVKIYRQPFDSPVLITSVTARWSDFLWNGPLQIWLSTDGSVQRNGFVMKYSSVLTRCNATIQGNGNFSSPGYPYANYSSNLVCAYTLTSIGSALLINFTAIDLEPCCDKISVYSGQNATYKNLLTVLKLEKSAVVQVTGPTAVVIFSSDESVEGRGFSATVTPMMTISNFVPESGNTGDLFWTGLHKENEKYYWDAVTPVLDTTYYSSCPGSTEGPYCWNCNDSMSTDCASGQLSNWAVATQPRLVVASAECYHALPYFCVMNVSSPDLISVPDPVFGPLWQYNALTDSCYKYMSESKNFSDARQSCAAESSSLAVPTTNIELSVIMNLPPAQVVTYIGVRYIIGSFVLDTNGIFTVSATWASMLRTTADVEDDSSLPRLYITINSTSCLVLQVFAGTPILSGRTCSGSYPYICTKSCSNGIAPLVLTWNETTAVLTCHIPTHNPASIFWTRNGDYIQQSVYPIGSSLNVSGPLAEYRCGILNSSDYSKRILSNPVLASGGRGATAVYRIVLTLGIPYDVSMRRYLYYNGNTGSLPTSTITTMSLVTSALVSVTRGPNESVTLDGIDSAGASNFTSLRFLVGVQIPTGVVAYSSDLQDLMSAFRNNLTAVLKGIPVLPILADPTVRPAFYCYPMDTSFNNMIVHLQQMAIGEMMIIPGCCYALCEGNFTAGANWGPVTALPDLTSQVQSTATSQTLNTTSSIASTNIPTTSQTITLALNQTTVMRENLPAAAPASDQIQKLTQGKISANNVHEIGSAMISLTSSTTNLTSADVANAAVVISRMADLLATGNFTPALYPVPSLIGKVVGNLMNADPNVFAATRNSTKTSVQASLESSLRSLTEAAAQGGPNVDSSFLKFQEDNLAFQIVVNPAINGLSIGFASSLGQASLQPLHVNDSVSESTNGTVVRLSEAVADLPKTFIVYSSSKLFQANSSLQADGKVISAQLVTPAEERRPGLITLVFAGVPEIKNGTSRTCGFWNYTLGDWSSSGCYASLGNNSQVTCTCDHLTNFAALLATNNVQPIDVVNAKVLDIISFVGLAISIVSLTAVVLSFLAFRKMRRTVSQKVLFNLALSLLSLDVLFVVGIDRTDNRAGCIAVAVLLHYFLLTSFLWMLMESVLQYLRFVKVLGTYIPRFIIKTAIPAWGAPAVAVAAICGKDVNLYYREDNSYCFAKEEVVYYAILLPIGIVLLINWVMFAIVLRSVCCRSRKFAHHSKRSEKSSAMLHAQAGIAICVVLGLTWIFGFLTPIPEVSLAFQYLFCICNSLQGLLIFVFHCAREKSLRDEWRRLCCGIEPATRRSTMSTMDDSTVMSSATGSTRNSSVSTSLYDSGGAGSSLPNNRGSNTVRRY